MSSARTLGSICLRAALTCIFLSLLIFAAASMTALDSARALLGPLATEEQVAALRQSLGTRDAWPIQYARWLQQIGTGNLGFSVFHQRPALNVVTDLVPVSLVRFAFAALLGTALGFLFGTRRWMSLLSSQAACFGLLAVPAFTIAALTLWIAARLASLTPISAPAFFGVITVLIASIPTTVLTGTTLSEWLYGDHPPTRTRQYLAYSGAPENYTRLLLIREALPSIAAVIANSLISVLTAVTFCEYVFSLRGFGNTFLTATQRGDMPIVIAGSLIALLILLPAQFAGDAISSAYTRRLARIS